MAIGMNKGRGVGRAKAGIGVPKKAGPQAPNVANGSKFKPIPGGFKSPPPGGAPKKSLPPGPYGSYKSHQKGKK